jgi:hypothetical protein
MKACIGEAKRIVFSGGSETSKFEPLVRISAIARATLDDSRGKDRAGKLADS